MLYADMNEIYEVLILVQIILMHYHRRRQYDDENVSMMLKNDVISESSIFSNNFSKNR